MALRGDPAVESEAEAAAAMHRRSAYVFSPTVLFPALAYARFTRSDLGGAIDAPGRSRARGHARRIERAQR